MDRELWNKAESLFLACADLPESQQQRFLEERCEGDAELRAIVETLLKGDRTEDLVRDAIDRVASDLHRNQGNRWIGRQIGAYTIESRIAEGGMGVVYRARRSDDQFEQLVAVKLLATSLPTAQSRQLFLSERQFLAKLQHPNIAMLFDGGETEEGVPYLVMECVDGTPIDTYCRDQNLSIEARIALFILACSAVQYAHANLVIHRDIKPSNILVTPEGVPKLLDFGIAKLIDTQSSPAALELTVHGARPMTPRHASPEQIRGEPMTTASDVYSLGVLLYELLCGEQPYAITAKTSAAEAESIISTHSPPAPSTNVPPMLAKRLRGDLDTIVLKCLRKEPAERYQSVVELSDDLQRYLDSRPIVARPPTTAYLVSRYWQRHRTALIGLATTAVALIAGLFASTIGFMKAVDAERTAIREAQNAETISAFLSDILQEAHPDTSAGRELSVRQVLAAGRDRIDDELGDSPVLKARILETLAGVYKGLADYDEAVALQAQAVSLIESHAPDDLVTRARLSNDLGDLYRLQSQHDQAQTMIEDALELYRRSGIDMSPEWADAISNLGLIYQESGRQALAGSTLLQAYEARRQLFAPPHPTLALSLHNLAWHQGRGGDMELAEKYALEAVAMREEFFGEIHPRVAASVSLLSRIYQQQDRWDDAEREARRAVAIAGQIFDSGHPDLSFPVYELASILHWNGKLQEAVELFAQVVSWERVSLGVDSHDFGMSLKAYAAVLTDLGEYGRAEPLLRQSLDIFEALPEGSLRSLQNARTDLGEVLIVENRLDEAATLLGAERELVEEEFDSRSTMIARHIVLCRYYVARGDLGRAQDMIDAALLLAGDPGTIDQADEPELLVAQSQIMIADSRSESAVPLLLRAREQLVRRHGSSHWRVASLRTTLGGALLDAGKFDAGRQELLAAHTELATTLGDAHPETRRAGAILDSMQRTPSH
jgi:serine/threonine protein kinase